MQNPFFKTMADIILSLSNSRVKELVKLRESAKRRRELGHFVIEGYPDLKCIYKRGREVVEIFFCWELIKKAGLEKEFSELEDLDFLLTELSKDAFSKASYRKGSDGFLSIAHTWPLLFENTIQENSQICIVLDEIEKPGNLGAIIRTAEAFGVNSILLSDSSVDFFNPNVVRSSRGLMAGINIGMGTKEEVYAFLEEKNFMLVGTSGASQNSYWEQEFNKKTAFIFGSEKDGLGNFWLDRLTCQIKIPMKGNADSLNLHASAACILAEYNRREFI
jgi:TrmH family RNA methyltransferase